MANAPDFRLPRGAEHAFYPSRSPWLFSWPLLVGAAVYLYGLLNAGQLLRDGDTYWHIAAGHWILQHGSVPNQDPFSHTMPGAPWVAHEWLSEVILAAIHQAGGWAALVAATALAFAATVTLLTRALLRSFEPIHALLFAGLAVAMTAGHVLARPHMLALPLMMIWTIELVRSSEAGRTPRLWLLPVMTLWANLHGGFTLGLGLALVFALEALLAARREQRLASAAKSWGVFLVLGLASALITPHGIQGILFTWQVMFESSYALQRIGEWQSPNFQAMQPLELWLLGGLALVMSRGLRLPPVRLLLLLGLVHLALKHLRYVELLGLLAPLFVASSLAAQWHEARDTKQQLERADRFFRKLAQPAGQAAILISFAAVLAGSLLITRTRPFDPPETAAPVLAIRAAQEAGIKGPVLNNYDWGGYLIYSGIPAFIDGRAEMYGDAFLKEYVQALELRTSDSLPKLLAKHKIAWTLLPPNTAAIALLDRLPEWRRLYADKTAVVHVRANIVR